MLKIKELRLKAHITQKDFSQKLKVSQTAVSLWESGATNPRSDDIPAIAEALGCTIGELYGEEPANK